MVCRSTAEPKHAIPAHIKEVYEDPKPFRWHNSANGVLAPVEHFCLRAKPN